MLERGLRVPVAADGGRLGLLKLFPAPVRPGQAAHLQGRGGGGGERRGEEGGGEGEAEQVTEECAIVTRHALGLRDN